MFGRNLIIYLKMRVNFNLSTLKYAIVVLLGLATLASSKALYDPVKSYVTVLNPKNWDGQVAKNRNKGITIVHFYKDTGKYKLRIIVNNGKFLNLPLRQI